jgi:hypothetical protein
MSSIPTDSARRSTLSVSGPAIGARQPSGSVTANPALEVSVPVCSGAAPSRA